MLADQTVHFEKFHGNGNDFIFIESAFLSHFKNEKTVAGFVKKISDRYFGVGADGVVFYKVTDSESQVLIVNSDGSVAEHCGNALRCLGLKLLQNGSWDGKKSLFVFKLEVTSLFPRSAMSSPGLTGGSAAFATLVKGDLLLNKQEAIIHVAMGKHKNVCLTPLVENSLASFGAEMDFLTPVFVELANPHWVFISPVFAGFSEKMFIEFGIFAQTTLRTKLLEKFSVPLANINMLTLNKKNATTWDLTVYERGAGFTLCCGSGATASRIALEFSELLFKEQKDVQFKMPGGIVSLAKNEINKLEQFVLSGPAEKLFSGSVFASAFV